MNPEYFTLISSLCVALGLGVLVVVFLLLEIKELNAKLALKDKHIAELYASQETYKPFSMRA